MNDHDHDRSRTERRLFVGFSLKTSRILEKLHAARAKDDHVGHSTSGGGATHRLAALEKISYRETPSLTMSTGANSACYVTFERSRDVHERS